MRDSNKSERLYYVDLTIEDNEDLAVRPWKGPSVLGGSPFPGTDPSHPSEDTHALIKGEEDVTVRASHKAPVAFDSGTHTHDPIQKLGEGSR